MKTFMFTVKIGRKVIYQSTFSLDEMQEKSYLETICSRHIGLFNTELEVVVIHTEGIKKWRKNADMWREITVEQCIEQFPDYAICSYIMTCCYDEMKISGIADILGDLPDGAENNTVNQTENFSWICKRIS